MSPTENYRTIIRPYDADAIAEAAQLIGAGECVAVPTETVYGLAADATNDEAVARIFVAKGRPAFNPLIVHVLDLLAAEELAVFSETARKLARRFWPGPLTIVLPRRPDCPVACGATAGLETVALRVPAHRAMRALLAASGVPLAAPSANSSGRISPTRAAHVAASLAGRVGLIIDDGPTQSGVESTVVSLSGDEAHVLRPGPITTATLQEIVKLGDHRETELITSPGQLQSHYAPCKPLRINANERRAGEWMIGFGIYPGDSNLSFSGNLAEAALRLFDQLYAAEASDSAAIAVAPIPEAGLGVAVNDRLRRAAAAKPDALN